MQPRDLQARAAAEFSRARQATTLNDAQSHEAMGTALADLAATGRYAYARLQGLSFKLGVPGRPSDWDGLRARTQNELAQGEGRRPLRWLGAMARALDRTYAVAWSLRGPVAHRVAQRPALGWIAVSGEDDKPHRPVNVPAPLPRAARDHNGTTLILGVCIGMATRFIVAYGGARGSAGGPGEQARTWLPRSSFFAGDPKRQRGGCSFFMATARARTKRSSSFLIC